jgi:DNA-binding response OmpR family regulator
MTMPVSPVARVLIVEDEPMIAFMLEDTLTEAGFKIAGIAAKLQPALTMIESGGCDVAILDANLAGVSSAPAASALTARGLPFLVLSGYSSDQQKGAFPGALRLQKPCQPERLIEALRSILRGLDPRRTQSSQEAFCEEDGSSPGRAR